MVGGPISLPLGRSLTSWCWRGRRGSGRSASSRRCSSGSLLLLFLVALLLAASLGAQREERINCRVGDAEFGLYKRQGMTRQLHCLTRSQQGGELELSHIFAYKKISMLVTFFVARGGCPYLAFHTTQGSRQPAGV